MLVWKQSFQAIQGSVTTRFPKGAVLISAREQGNLVAVWALCDPANPVQESGIELVETGRERLFKGDFVGTAIFDDGAYVLHVFSVDD